MSAPTKLERLVIGEVSGVDDPANELPGWMVAKATGQTELLVGHDAPWDVADAELRIREATGATDAPTAKYASCFLWPGNDTTPDKFADYKFLVCDVVDGRVSVMPRALKAVGDRLPYSSLSDDDKDAVAAKLTKLRERVGAAEAVSVAEDATSIVGKIANLLRGKDEVDMTKDELNAVLDERFGSLADKLAETLSKSAEAPATEVAPPAAPEVTPAATPEAGEPIVALTAEDVSKAIDAALQPVLEVCDKMLDRLAEVEGRFATRKSLDGQEGGEGGDESNKPPTFGQALAKAMRSGQTLECSG